MFYKVDIDDVSSATIKFIYADKNISKDLSNSEIDEIKDMFNNRTTFHDTPSCGFDENISITINDDIFCIACDTCPFVYYKNKDTYFRLSDEEHERLVDIFESHGGYFPCV